jgi:ubiquinone/menaquinone biosynthesis C-methylase UbiE
MGFYDRYILPPLINMACGAVAIGRQRERLVPRAGGVVLELGFGSGLNLAHYDRAKVQRLYALEPSAGMLVRARKLAAISDLDVEILAETAEALSLAAGTVDTVLVTYSLCTIPDPLGALAAARRALKPGGELLFCEHGRAPDEKVRRTQARVEPVWKHIAGGCHLTRDIPSLVRTAGFEIQDLDSRYLPGAPGWAGFNYSGSARPS